MRNKLNTVDIFDYKKIKQILSFDDIAQWCYYNNVLSVNNPNNLGSNTFISSVTLDMFFNKVTLEGKDHFELLNHIQPMSKENGFIENCKSRLSQDTYHVSEPQYSFISVNGFVIVILKEGFLSSIKNKQTLLDFIRDYLKSCYSNYTIPRVSLLSMYNLYVEML